MSDPTIYIYKSNSIYKIVVIMGLEHVRGDIYDRVTNHSRGT